MSYRHDYPFLQGLIGRLVGEMRGYLGVTSKLRTEKTPPVAGKHVADKLRFMLPGAA
ncbi:hypothetical protein WRSd5_01099 [Shigella dysenteriae WRSd5]|nr:hypothetical protein WRSd5_01099 [Shigella dysenteriae WRSd5]